MKPKPSIVVLFIGLFQLLFGAVFVVLALKLWGREPALAITLGVVVMFGGADLIFYFGFRKQAFGGK